MIRAAVSLLTAATLAGGAGFGAMGARYQTFDPCAAAADAVRDETPAIMDDLAREDVRFRAVQIGGVVFRSTERLLEWATAEAAASVVADLPVAACAVLLLERELSPSSFRARVGREIANALDA